MTDVAFIGLGAMGRPMVMRLLESGFAVKVWNRSDGPYQALVDAGATRAADLADALSTGKVLSMLPDDLSAESVFNRDGLASFPAGSIHVNLSTVSLETAQRLTGSHKNAGISYISAPVLGRPAAAETGDLSLLAAGDSAAISKIRPLLATFSRRIRVVGQTPSAANLLKIGVNYNLIHTLQALAESIAMVESSGVDPQVFVDVLTESSYTGTAYTSYGRLMAKKNYRPVGFSLDLGLKDLALAEDAAHANGIKLATAGVLRSVLEGAMARPDLRDLDWACIAEMSRTGLLAPQTSSGNNDDVDQRVPSSEVGRCRAD